MSIIIYDLKTFFCNWHRIVYFRNENKISNRRITTPRIWWSILKLPIHIKLQLKVRQSSTKLKIFIPKSFYCGYRSETHSKAAKPLHWARRLLGKLSRARQARTEDPECWRESCYWRCSLLVRMVHELSFTSSSHKKERRSWDKKLMC